jgi:protein-disulfide isomerase
LAQDLGVQYVPTFVFAGADGVIAQQVVGEQTEEALRKMLDALK